MSFYEKLEKKLRTTGDFLAEVAAANATPDEFTKASEFLKTKPLEIEEEESGLLSLKSQCEAAHQGQCGTCTNAGEWIAC